MATLVLTAVGSAIGGPLGGALGAAIGNRIDRATILRGATREGPRLAELAVQTSSYGSAIPRLYGTMRVAGTVIWSTDLIETRGRAGGGKGQPATATYSYAASFAVLLSGRPIMAIGRIWADGRLVRGAAGDLKVKAVLRVHTGVEDQPVDPLIASAEGGIAPAYRGMAYLVFEQLPLAEFGNRIPSLTVEVIAGEATVGAVAHDVAREVTAAPAVPLPGFAAAGSVRGVLAVLEQVAGGWWAARGGGVALCDADGVVRVVGDDAVRAAGGKGMVRGRSTSAIERVAKAVTVSHYDPARDYQAGYQRAARPGAGEVVRAVEMPAVLDAGAAKALAGALLLREEADRVRRTIGAGLAAIDVAPGALVRITGEDGLWRVVSAVVEGWAVRLVLSPVAGGAAATAATSGRVSGAADRAIGRTLLQVAELPALGDVALAAPRVTVVAAGTGVGWRQATLMWSADDGASWTEAGATAAAGVLGRVEAMPSPAPAALVDEAGVLVVRLAHDGMALHDADDAALDRGANLAMAGGELIQFGRAEPLGAARWRLTRLWRRRRGSAAVAGDVGFALLTEEGARAIDLPLAAIGREIRIMATGSGDDVPVEARAMLAGVSVRPPVPVHLRTVRDAEGTTLLWIRRSRAGWRWGDGVDAPLAEEAEWYRVTLANDAGEETVEVAEPRLRLPPRFAAAGARATVRQRGSWAESAGETIVIEGDMP